MLIGISLHSIEVLTKMESTEGNWDELKLNRTKEECTGSNYNTWKSDVRNTIDKIDVLKMKEIFGHEEIVGNTQIILKSFLITLGYNTKKKRTNAMKKFRDNERDFIEIAKSINISSLNFNDCKEIQKLCEGIDFAALKEEDSTLVNLNEWTRGMVELRICDQRRLDEEEDADENEEAPKFNEDLKEQDDNETQKLPLLSEKKVGMMYSKITGQKIKFGPDCRVSIEMDKANGRELVKKLKKFRLPKFADFDIRYVEEDDEDVKELLTHSISEPLVDFTFNWYAKYNKRLKFQSFQKVLCSIALKVTHEFTISQFDINGEELIEILSASKNCKSIKIAQCKIEISCDLEVGDKLNGWTAHSLSFYGSQEMSGWLEDPSKFTKLWKALAKSEDFLDSLGWLDISRDNKEINFWSNLIEGYVPKGGKDGKFYINYDLS